MLTLAAWHGNSYRQVTECCRTCTYSGRAVSTPPGSCWILLGAATSPLNLRRQVEQPDVRRCIPTGSPHIQPPLGGAALSPMHGRNSFPGWAWHLHPRVPAVGFTVPAAKLLQVQQNCLPGSSVLRILPFPVPTQPNTAGHIHNPFSPTLGFMLPAAKPGMTASLPLGP